MNDYGISEYDKILPLQEGYAGAVLTGQVRSGRCAARRGRDPQEDHRGATPVIATAGASGGGAEPRARAVVELGARA